jgi:4-hydroxybenzoate polyprenyltransferase
VPIEPQNQKTRSQADSPTGEGASGGNRVLRLFDALAHSSAIAAGVAASFVWAVSLAFGLVPDAAVVTLAATGTLVVYNVDRLRDVERDRLLAPLRSQFVAENRKPLVALSSIAALASLASAAVLPTSTAVLCGAVLALGLLHRRLKRVRGIKTLYLTGSWLSVTVGLPVLAAPTNARPDFETLYWVGLVVGCAIVSNLMASNLDRRRANESAGHANARRRLNPAIAVAGLGLGVALVAPEALRGFALIPGAEFLALSRYRARERYTAVVLDGALFVGACGTIACFVLWGPG